MADKNVILKNIIGDVLHPEIADNSITTDKIIDGAITKEKLDPEVLSSKADNGIMIDIVNAGSENESSPIPVWKAVYDIPNRVIEQAFRKGVPVNFVIRDGYNYDQGSGESKYHLIPVYYMYFQQNNGSIELKAKSKDFIIYAHPIASGDYSKLGYITQNRWYVGKYQIDTEDISDKVVTKDKLANNALEDVISWSELKTLRDSSELIPGHQYRITDYQCTTTLEGTQSAGHQFDIIVTADSNNKLNEKARACLHNGDNYFKNSNLAAWQLWYSLDNDTKRFAWADDSILGRGVIYRMIDEWNNDCPYDFKNILFKRYKITKSKSLSLIGTYLATKTDSTIGLEVNNNDSKMFYTFSYLGELNTQADYNGGTLEDASIIGNTLYSDDSSPYGVHGNTIKYYFDIGIESSEPIQSLNNIVFLTYTDGEAYYGCYYNSFGNNCINNSFGNNCTNNLFSDDNQFIIFGDNCTENLLFNSCKKNSFGQWCYGNLINYCNANVFGDNCSTNYFGQNCNNNSFGNYYQLNTFDSGVQNIIFNGDGTSSKPIQNYHVKHDMVFDFASKYTIIAKPGLNYVLSVAKKSDGTVVEYNEADTHKLVSITASDYAALITKDSNTLYCIPEE